MVHLDTIVITDYTASFRAVLNKPFKRARILSTMTIMRFVPYQFEQHHGPNKKEPPWTPLQTKYWNTCPYVPIGLDQFHVTKHIIRKECQNAHGIYKTNFFKEGLCLIEVSRIIMKQCCLCY
jgi:hypothetical protein